MFHAGDLSSWHASSSPSHDAEPSRAPASHDSPPSSAPSSSSAESPPAEGDDAPTTAPSSTSSQGNDDVDAAVADDGDDARNGMADDSAYESAGNTHAGSIAETSSHCTIVGFYSVW